MLSRYVTSFIVSLLEGGPRNLGNIESRLFHATSALRKKKNRFWGKKETGPKIIKPADCANSPKPICDPKCKIAIVVGGSDGFGFAAADHLLCKGVRNVVIVDNDSNQGQLAAQRLCGYHGKDRVLFLEGDLKNITHFEGALQQISCRHKKIDIIFNDLDREWYSVNKLCVKPEKQKNNTSIAVQSGLKFLAKDQGGSGGIIINCASIFGFLGWPQDPFPIYCKKEPAIEVTMDLAKEYKEQETGVRLVSLCPANKPFSEIGLPDFPEPIPNKDHKEMPSCVPTSKYQIGPALCHVLAWANSGSVWLVEPACCARDIPRLIHFPASEGQKVDPKVYETEPCPVRVRSPCVPASNSAAKNIICKIKGPKAKSGTEVL